MAIVATPGSGSRTHALNTPGSIIRKVVRACRSLHTVCWAAQSSDGIDIHYQVTFGAGLEIHA